MILRRMKKKIESSNVGKSFLLPLIKLRKTLKQQNILKLIFSSKRPIALAILISLLCQVCLLRGSY